MNCRNCGKLIPQESVYCMFCGAPVFSPRPDPSRSPEPEPEPMPAPPVFVPPPPVPMRVCSICGCELPDGCDSDICISCQFVRDFSAGATLSDDPAPPPPPKKNFKLDLNLDEEYGDLPQKRKLPHLPRWLLPAVFGLLVLIAAVIFLPRLWANKPADSAPPAASEADPQEGKAISFAQEMVKAAARDPASVHFDKQTVKVSQDLGDYIVTQQFERANTAGETVAAHYEAVLTFVPSADKAYTPLMLKVDDAILYDYR